jgi:hypothetical protein
MSRASWGNTPDIECLLKAESVLVPEPEAVRRRVLGRARAALSSGLLPGRTVDARLSRPLGKAAAAIVLLVGLTATAYELGHRQSKWSRVAAEATVPTPTPAPAPATIPAPAEATSLTQPSIEMGTLKGSPNPPATLRSRLSRLAPHASEPMPAPPRRPARSRPLPAAAPTVASDAYASELRLLRPAQMALSQSSFANALALVDEHLRRFPSGRLAEEREALRVKALLGLDRREEARRAATAFRTRFPNSALLARIQAMLGTDP